MTLASPLVGVLALQGDVDEHVRALESSGAACRRCEDGKKALASVEALVIPGGESTTVIRLLDRFAMAEPIVARVRAGMPLWGTCMGMIVASTEVCGSRATHARTDRYSRPPQRLRPSNRIGRSRSRDPGTRRTTVSSYLHSRTVDRTCGLERGNSCRARRPRRFRALGERHGHVFSSRNSRAITASTAISSTSFEARSDACGETWLSRRNHTAR